MQYRNLTAPIGRPLPCARARIHHRSPGRPRGSRSRRQQERTPPQRCARAPWTWCDTHPRATSAGRRPSASRSTSRRCPGVPPDARGKGDGRAPRPRVSRRLPLGGHADAAVRALPRLSRGHRACGGGAAISTPARGSRPTSWRACGWAMVLQASRRSVDAPRSDTTWRSPPNTWRVIPGMRLMAPVAGQFDPSWPGRARAECTTVLG